MAGFRSSFVLKTHDKARRFLAQWMRASLQEKRPKTTGCVSLFSRETINRSILNCMEPDMWKATMQCGRCERYTTLLTGQKKCAFTSQVSQTEINFQQQNKTIKKYTRLYLWSFALLVI